MQNCHCGSLKETSLHMKREIIVIFEDRNSNFAKDLITYRNLNYKLQYSQGHYLTLIKMRQPCQISLVQS